MQPFIRPDQFNLLRFQAYKLIGARSTSIDRNVVRAVTSIVQERIRTEFQNRQKEERQFIEQLIEVKDEGEVQKVLEQLKPYVIPFQVTEQQVKKLFPKVKKLKVPALEQIDMRDVTYLTWRDPGAQKKFIVTNGNQKRIGLQGSFQTSVQKGICTICNRHESVGLFLVEIKRKERGTFKKKGNYICCDGEVCNRNLTSLDPLFDFVDHLRK